MTNTDDLTPYPMLWSAYAGTTQAIRDATFMQIQARLDDFSMSSVQSILNQASSSMKSVVWAIWSKKADLSGVQLSDVYGLLDTEPHGAIYSIITEWVAKVDLKHYDLRQVSKAASLLRGMDDKQRLWTRWLKTSKELETVHLDAFCDHIKDYAPELQLVLINGFATNVPSLAVYSQKEREAARKHLAPFAANQCPIFVSSVTLKNGPRYDVGDVVRLENGATRKVTGKLESGGVWHYSLEGEFKYIKEHEIAGRHNG